MFADHLVPAGDRLHRSAETIGPVADLCDGHADNVAAALLETFDQLLGRRVDALAIRLESVEAALGVDVEGRMLGRTGCRIDRRSVVSGRGVAGGVDSGGGG